MHSSGVKGFKETSFHRVTDSNLYGDTKGSKIKSLKQKITEVILNL